MSALQQILAEHSRNISDNLSHANEIATDNSDRKANDLEEKFQHVKDSIEGAGGDLAAIGGAYHMGRKIYKKVQQAKRAAQAIRGTGTDSSSVQVDLPEGESPGGESGGSQSTPKQASEAPEADPESVTQPSDTPTAGETEGESSSVQPEQAEAPESGGGGSEGLESSVAEPKSLSGQGDYSISESMGKLPDEAGEARKIASVADEAADTGTEAASGAGDVAGNLLGKTSAMVVNNADTATQAASKLAGIGGDALSAGLDTASAVLDALGPVGEVAGVVTSLVGLFEGLAHKKKDVDTGGEAATAEAPTQAAVDPKALAETSTM